MIENIKELIDDIVSEVAFRTDSGLVDFRKREHIYILSEVLTEMGLGGVKDELIYALTEVDEEKPKSPDDDKYSHKAYGYYVRKGDEEKEDAQVYTKGDDGTYTPASTEDYEKAAAERGEQGASSPASPKPKDGVVGGGDTQQAQPEKGAALNPNTKGGAAWNDKLPDGDPAKVNNVGSDSEFKKQMESNTNNIRNFIKVGFDDSKGAPGNRGSMLNETTSILSATQYLNSGNNFDYDEALRQNVKLLKSSKLGKENDGTIPSGRVKAKEAKLVADQYGISVGLASKIIIATRSAKKKHDRVNSKILKKNNITNFESIPLFGDKGGLETQLKLVNSVKGEIKLGNTTITKDEAIKIINEGGGGSNPSDTAIFVIDKDTGNLHMTFFSDKDATNAIVAQSSLTAENEYKKTQIDELVRSGILNEEEVEYYKTQMDTSIKQFQELEESLSNVVNGPGEHLLSQNVSELVDKSKKLSGGKNPSKYWESVVVSKFTSTKNSAHKKIMTLLPDNHSNPPNDEEMMSAYLKWINLEENRGNLPKADQRVVTDLSNQTNGPKLGAQLGEIRKKSVAADLALIKKLDEKKVLVNGKSVGLGTLLEAKSVSEKLHLSILFGGEGVYQDEDAFCQENGGVTVTKQVMESCLPFDNQNDMITSFEVGEEVDQIQRGDTVVTGGSKIVYAVTMRGEKIPIGEKKQRSKQGILGKLSTVYNFHPELQKCFDKNGK